MQAADDTMLWARLNGVFLLFSMTTASIVSGAVIERSFKLDDTVGAIAVHGYTGFYRCMVAGFLLCGYSSSPHEGYAAITLLGTFIGAVIMFLVLGYIPGKARCIPSSTARSS